MGIQVKRTTTHIYTCDRCGHQSEDEFSKGRQASITAAISGITYDGATGGLTAKYWLCGSCTTEFQTFMRGVS